MPCQICEIETSVVSTEVLRMVLWDSERVDRSLPLGL